MKRLMAVLELVCVVAGSAMLLTSPPKAHATQAPQYKCQFFATGDTNFLGGVYYPYGLCGGSQVFGTNAFFELFPGQVCSGSMIVDVDNQVCGTGFKIGNFRNCESTDGGVTWTYFPLHPVTMVGAEAKYEIDIVAFMQPGEQRVACPGGGTGGQ